MTPEQIAELIAERDTLRAELDALQSGDELPEPAGIMAVFDVTGTLMSGDGYTADQLRQAQAMARAKLLAELGEAEAVAVVEKEPDYWSGGNFYEGSKSHIDPTKIWHLPTGTKLYTRPLPAQDVNSELVEALEAAQRWHNGDKWRDTDKHEEWAAQAEMISTSLANAKAAQQKGGM